MTSAFLDTTVLIHLFRKNPNALAWFSAQQVVYSVTPITWMEVMVGVANKQMQADSLNLLNGLEMIYLRPTDQDWAMQQMQTFRLSKGVSVMDCFNASVCYRLNVPIYTHNRKDFLKLLPSNLVITPY